MSAGRSEVWPVDINNIQISNPQYVWVSEEDQNGYAEDHYAKQYGTGKRPIRSSLQLQQGGNNGLVIGNHYIPQSLQPRFVTSRTKHPNPGPTLSFHNIHYTVKRRCWKITRKAEPQPILKGIRYISNSSYCLYLSPTT